MSEKQVFLDAKKSVRSHIKLLKGVLQSLDSPDQQIRFGALITGWCLNRYINELLLDDVNRTADQMWEPEE